jgi:SOS response regulatory protein OraA/RecX
MDVTALVRHATRLLSNRPHSSGELRLKLLRVALRASARAPGDGVAPASVADAALADLRARGLLDDGAYARWHVSQREMGTRARSKAELANELSARRIPAGVASAAMENYDDSRVAARIVARKPASPRGVLARHLTWKGFSYSTIDAVLRKEET